MKFLARKLIIINREGKDMILPLSIIECEKTVCGVGLQLNMFLAGVKIYPFVKEVPGTIYVNNLQLIEKGAGAFIVSAFD